MPQCSIIGVDLRPGGPARGARPIRTLGRGVPPFPALATNWAHCACNSTHFEFTSRQTQGATPMALDTQLADKLETALHHGRIQDGIELLSLAKEEIGELHSGNPEAGRILLLYSQWIDAGFGDYRILLPLLERFPPECRKGLPLSDYARVRMASAFVDLARGELDAAIETLGSVLHICRDVFDPGLEALAHFWKGRAHRKNGEYESALGDMASAHELAHDNNRVVA